MCIDGICFLRLQPLLSPCTGMVSILSHLAASSSGSACWHDTHPFIAVWEVVILSLRKVTLLRWLSGRASSLIRVEVVDMVIPYWSDLAGWTARCSWYNELHMAKEGYFTFISCQLEMGSWALMIFYNTAQKSWMKNGTHVSLLTYLMTTS